MELLQLKYFCSVARFENISRAAHYHQIPQPAMSKTMSKLENELGVGLFHRGSNNISLTAAGRIFYDKVKPAIDAIDNAKAQAGAAPAFYKQAVILYVESHYPLLTHLVGQFGNTNNSGAFTIYTKRVKDAHKGDLYINTRSTAQEGYQSQMLVKDAICLALYKGHPLAKEKTIHPQRLMEEQWVLTLGNEEFSGALIQLKESGIDPRTAFYCDNEALSYQLIGEGHGIGFAYGSYGKLMEKQGVLLRPLDGLDDGCPLYIHWTKNILSSNFLAALFKDYLITALAPIS